MDIHERNDMYYKAVAWAEHDFAAACRRVNDMSGADIQIGHEAGAYCRSIADVEAILEDVPHARLKPCKCGESMLTMPARVLFYESANLTSSMEWFGAVFDLDWKLEDDGVTRNETFFRVWERRDYDNPIFRVRRVNQKAELVSTNVALSWLGPEWEKRFEAYREERYAKRGWPVVKAYLEKKREHANA